MSKHVCDGAQLMCSFGTGPSALKVLPVNKMKTSSKPAANIMDFKPMVNIQPFNMCTSIANPLVASATAAALGTLTPQKCQPVTTTPWSPGVPNVMLAMMPVLNDVSILNCAFLGVIKVQSPGQTTENVPP